MSAIKIFEHIGSKIKSANPWINSFAVNCIQLPDGRIVNLIGNEKEEFSFDDSKGYGFYIRTNPKFEYTALKQISSSSKNFRVQIKFKFVFFAIDQEAELDPIKLENVFSNNFRVITFTDYFGVERNIEIVIQNTNVDATQIFFDESKKERDAGNNIVAISLEGVLRFESTNDNCEADCGLITSSNILQSFDFCDPAVIASLCSKQVECLRAEFGGGFANWGDITGDITDQTDLNNILIDLQEQIDNIPGGSALTYNYIAGETLGGQRIVMISGGKVFYFDPLDENNSGKQLGFTDTAAITDDSVNVISNGVIESAGWGLTPDAVYYAAIDGTISITPISSGISMRVGVAISAEKLKIEFSEPIIIL